MLQNAAVLRHVWLYAPHYYLRSFYTDKPLGEPLTEEEFEAPSRNIEVGYRSRHGRPCRVPNRSRTRTSMPPGRRCSRCQAAGTFHSRTAREKRSSLHARRGHAGHRRLVRDAVAGPPDAQLLAPALLAHLESVERVSKGARRDGQVAVQGGHAGLHRDREHQDAKVGCFFSYHRVSFD